MKSIRYLLGGPPKNLDDCLDLAQRLGDARVTVELDASPAATDLRLFLDLVAHYVWEFPAAGSESSGGRPEPRTVAYSETCGTCPSHVGGRTAARELARADGRLRRSIERIRSLGIPVSQPAESFSSQCCLT